MSISKTLVPLSLVGIVSCTTINSSQPQYLKRTIASAEGVNATPSWLFFENQPIQNFLVAWKKAAEKFPLAASTNDQFLTSNQIEFGSLLEKRLQSIAQKITTRFNWQNIPIPQLILVADKTPNAFVRPHEACYKATVRVNPEKLGYAYPSMRIDNLTKDSWTIEQNTTVDCEEPPTHLLSLMKADLARKVVKHDQATCIKEMTDSDITFTCQDSNFSNTAKSLSWMQMTPYVFVHVGLVSSLQSWDELDAILAHELGHYYLLHGTDSDHRGYFYDRKLSNKSFRPPPSKDLKELGDVLLTLGHLKNGDGFEDFYQSSYVGGLLKEAANYVGIYAKYRPTEFLFTSKDCIGLMGALSSRTMLTLVRNCFQTVKTTGPETLDSYIKLLISGKDRKVIRMLLKENLSQKVDSAWNAFQIIDASLSQAIHGLSSSEPLQRVGYYTYEEEADVFAIDYLLSTGRDVQSLIEGLLSMVKGYYPFANPKFRREIEQCEIALRNGWKMEGKPVAPVIEDFEDLHHGICYRLYNADQLARKISMPATSQPSDQETVSFMKVRDAFQRYSRQIRP